MECELQLLLQLTILWDVAMPTQTAMLQPDEQNIKSISKSELQKLKEGVDQSRSTKHWCNMYVCAFISHSHLTEWALFHFHVSEWQRLNLRHSYDNTVGLYFTHFGFKSYLTCPSKNGNLCVSKDKNPYSQLNRSLYCFPFRRRWTPSKT